MTKENKLKNAKKIWVIHHTHVDIGYTEPQHIILRKHAEFIAHALGYLESMKGIYEHIS